MTQPPVPGLADLALLVAEQRRESEQQQQQLDQLRQDVHLLLAEVTDSFTALTRRLDEAGRPPAGPGGPGGPRPARGWRGLDQVAAGRLWQDLADWLAWLHGRFPLLGRVPPCWWRHPAVVEHLTALYLAWWSAYEDPQAGPCAQADWLDRWLPATLGRLAEWTPRSCLIGTHCDDPAGRFGQALDDPDLFRDRTQPQ